jgi:hypothetical protein
MIMARARDPSPKINCNLARDFKNYLCGASTRWVNDAAVVQERSVVKLISTSSTSQHARFGHMPVLNSLIMSAVARAARQLVKPEDKIILIFLARVVSLLRSSSAAKLLAILQIITGIA